MRMDWRVLPWMLVVFISLVPAALPQHQEYMDAFQVLNREQKLRSIVHFSVYFMVLILEGICLDRQKSQKTYFPSHVRNMLCVTL